MRGLDEVGAKEAVRKNALEGVRISLERETRKPSKVFYEVEGGRKGRLISRWSLAR